MKIRGAIFDMDGTLLDSMHVWDGLCAEYLRSRGIAPRKEHDAVLAHKTLADAAEYLRTSEGLPESREVILSEMLELSEKLYDSVAPKPGVPEALALLSRHGVRMALATLTDRPTVLRVLDRVGLLPYFDVILTCAEVGAPKTSPLIYEEALRLLGTERANTPVFEDAWYAIKTAHAARFPVAAVYDRFSHCRHDRAATLATVLIDDWRTTDLAAYL